MEPVMTRRAMLATSLTLAIGALGWGLWRGYRSRAEQSPPPADGSGLLPEQASRARALALDHPTVRAVFGKSLPSEPAIQVGPLTAPDGRLAGASVWLPFEEPRSVRAEWIIPLDWQVTWPPSRVLRQTMTYHRAEGLTVWVDLSSETVLRVEPMGLWTQPDPAEDPRVLRGEQREQAIALALTAPWLEPLRAQAEPRVGDTVLAIQDETGTTVGALVPLVFPTPVTVKGTIPVLVMPEYGHWKGREIQQQVFDERISELVVAVSFEERRPLGITGLR